ncbi:hypothetical protein [Aciditerrimonas ferrireducens]|uniref:hypothetical protein n=1 Tax=Aciditerrimonas ferrireducens TaxID=667306 RepID=UPI00200697C1|nr:hypothetical protein [Aciditerrimonas ferrireducens]MCK4176075.1 hypothetical protein [Aciditerrimonas ferrireducens]
MDGPTELLDQALEFVDLPGQQVASLDKIRPKGLFLVEVLREDSSDLRRQQP